MTLFVARLFALSMFLSLLCTAGLVMKAVKRMRNCLIVRAYDMPERDRQVL